MVSYPVIGLSLLVSFIVMMVYYWLQNAANAAFPKDSYDHVALRIVPSILYSVVIIGLNVPLSGLI